MMTHRLPANDFEARVQYFYDHTEIYPTLSDPEVRMAAIRDHARLEIMEYRGITDPAKKRAWDADSHIQDLVRRRQRESASFSETMSAMREAGRRAKECPYIRVHEFPEKDESEEPDEEEDRTVYDKRNAGAEKSRLAYIWGEEGLDADDLDDRIIISAFFSIKASSFNSYASQWRALRSLDLPIDWHSLALYGHADYDRGTPKSMGTYKLMASAIKFYHKCHGIGPEGPRRQAEMSIVGLNKMHEVKAHHARGGITNEMLRDMLRLPDSVIPKTYKEHFTILHATGVRGNQYGRTVLSHVEHKNDKVFVICPANHKGRGGGKRYHWELHTARSEWQDEVWRIAESRRAAGHTLLAQGWDPVQGNAYIALAAQELGWPKDMVWVVHGLRHGATITVMADTKKDLATRIAEATEMTGHSSIQSVLWYGMPNDIKRLLGTSLRGIRAKLSNGGHGSRFVNACMEKLQLGNKEVHAEAKAAIVKKKQADNERIEGKKK